MLQITSKENQLIKHIIKLKEKKYRKEYNEYIIEGVKIVEESIEEKAKIKQIIISEDAINSELVQKHLKEKLQKIDYIQVPSNIFKLISEVEKPQGVLAVIEKENGGEYIDYNQDIILALDDLQDPGNLGTIIRTADSAGVDAIILLKGCVDIYNPKVIRSTMGSIFDMNIIHATQDDAVNFLKSNDFNIVSSYLQTDNYYHETTYDGKIALVIGNEANGINDELIAQSDKLVKIPIYGNAESLNAAISAAVLMYEIKKYLS